MLEPPQSEDVAIIIRYKCKGMHLEIQTFLKLGLLAENNVWIIYGITILFVKIKRLNMDF